MASEQMVNLRQEVLGILEFIVPRGSLGREIRIIASSRNFRTVFRNMVMVVAPFWYEAVAVTMRNGESQPMPRSCDRRSKPSA